MLSAFSPIVAPTQVPWGHKALAAYLGDDKAVRMSDDNVRLIENGAVSPLVSDQGLADNFYEEQLRTPARKSLC